MIFSLEMIDKVALKFAKSARTVLQQHLLYLQYSLGVLININNKLVRKILCFITSMKLLDHIIIVMQSLKAKVKNKLLNVADFIHQ